MERIIKNIPVKLEVGDYDNFMTLIPQEIISQYKCNGMLYPEYIIKFSYPNDDRTINLVISEGEIDFKSFN